MKPMMLPSVAACAIALAIAGAPPAFAKGKSHRHAHKTHAGKAACAGKGGCPAMGRSEGKEGGAPETAVAPPGK